MWIPPSTEKPKDAPCRYLSWNDLINRDVAIYPAVDCDGESCDTCGFNPEVKEQRLKKARGET